jgi:signal transduction histidine kinase
VIAANGTMTGIVAGVSPDRRRELVGRDFGNRTYVERALAGRTYVSEPIRAESGNYIVTISTPIRRDGEVVGTLNGAFHVSEAPIFESVARSISDSERMVVYAGSGDRIYAGSGDTAEDPFVANTTLRRTDWVVSVRQNRAATRALLQRTTYIQFGSLALVILSFAAFGWWNYRRNLQQVERLLGGFDALERKAYGTQIEIDGAREWARIGAAFNEMSRTLERAFVERERRERQLEVLDRVLRHNLRNVASVVRGHAEAIIVDEEGREGHAEKIVTANDELLALAEKERLITDLLQRDPSPNPVDVSGVVARATATVGERYPDATVTVDCPESVTALATDRLERAVLELVENGIEHVDGTAPTVTVSVTDTDDEVLIAVADEGPGIPEVERRIVRGEQTIDPLSHGAGLGLWLVALVVDQSGGELVFEEERAGSVVRIRLPTPPDTA